MSEQLSSGGFLDDSASGSPKRKKVRSKYTPKACVACRRSKLKCSGANPCQRCLDNGRRCFYSEDQTAAEALQHLSRPTPAQPSALAPNVHNNVNGNGNGNHHINSGPRRSTLSRSDVVERRTSDASLMGSSMEARMARIEGMMEALVQERGIVLSPQGSIEREGSSGDRFHTDADSFVASFAPARQPYSFTYDCPESQLAQLISGPSTDESSSKICIGDLTLPFPSPPDYQKYVRLFFIDINEGHPCVNEEEFRARSEQLLRMSVIPAGESSFMALNYIIFACVDIYRDSISSSIDTKPAGWTWFQIANAIAGKRKISGRGDLSLLQYCLLEAIYLIGADKPNAAYNVIGLACRLCFQFGLNQQWRWSEIPPIEKHTRQRIFWTVYVTDRRISLSCGRPYIIRDLDVDVDHPSMLYDQIAYLTTLSVADTTKQVDALLDGMIGWATLVGEAWDNVLAPTRHVRDAAYVALVDENIHHITHPQQANPLMHGQSGLVHMRCEHLRLVLHRQTMLSLNYDGRTGELCGDLALSTVSRIRQLDNQAALPSPFRFIMTAALGSAILVLSSLLVRDLGSIGLSDHAPTYAKAYKQAATLLHTLAANLQLARRYTDDLRRIMHIVDTILNGGDPSKLPSNIQSLFPYSSLDFAQQVGVPDVGDENVGSWDFELQPNGCLYGVPWVC